MEAPNDVGQYFYVRVFTLLNTDQYVLERNENEAKRGKYYSITVKQDKILFNFKSYPRRPM